MIREEFLHFIWEHRLFQQEGLKTTCGLALEVIDPGQRNIHAGPDFTCARIRANRLIWVGNVEIHSCSSDWKRHGHQVNPAYDNVILHVVRQYRGEVWNSRGNHVLTCILSVPDHLYQRYEKLIGTSQWLPCCHHIGKIPESLQRKWLSVLGRQRLDLKSQSIYRNLVDKCTSREETFFRVIASGFGLSNNCAPFYMLASRIPFRLLFELRDSLSDLEALFFGHSGLIDRGNELCTYAGFLKGRYSELSTTLPSQPVPAYLWQFLRLRPAAFPTVRLAQLASLIHQRIPLCQTVLHATSLHEMEQLLRVKASTFWDSHYQFERVAPPAPKYFGIQSVHLLIINAVIPYVEALGKAERQQKYIDWARNLLLQVETESNHIIKNWIKFGVRPVNAIESQGLIRLHQHYCRRKRCLDCMFGTFILDETIDEKFQP